MVGLGKYNAKRKFDKTTEPEGRKSEKKSEQIFVIQKHWASHLHFDFRLESGGVLKSWAVPKGIPGLGEKRLAMMVEDHPLDYRDFEGIIPEGNYGAGTVMVWDNGAYEIKDNQPLSSKINKGDFSFKLYGQKIQGEFSLVKLKKSDKNEWLFICKSRNDSPMDEDLSVKSYLSKEGIEGKNDIGDVKGAHKSAIQDFYKPMLASLSSETFNDESWLFEIKWDGYRVLAQKNKKEINLYSRNGKNFNKKFTVISQELAEIKDQFILDGEIVAVDEKGNSNFQLLQNYLSDKQASLVYYVFDILYLNGYDFRNVKLLERKKILHNFLEDKKFKNIRESEYILEKGKELFEVVEKHGGEGMMAKKQDSIYKPDLRSRDWLKIKTFKTQDVIICGYTLPRGSRKKFGALVVGVWEDGAIIFAGHVGGGFDERKLSLLMKEMALLATSKIPFEKKPKTNMPVVWLQPKLVCEVKFSEWTQEGIMRQPIFMRLRPDKEPRQTEKEKIIVKETERGDENSGIKGVKSKLTNLKKIYWPEESYTKGDLISYYDEISKFILPYLKNRPQSLNRFPNGIKGKNFFQKDINDAPPWAKTIKIFSESENKHINYLVCNDKKTLLYLANLGCIELNVWNSSIDSLDNPDYIVFDLDPQGQPFSQTVAVALETKNILDTIGLESFCKTSGSRGLHIYVPLKPVYSYEQIKELAKLINLAINQRLPDVTSLERKPEKRKNKIYLDYLQNRRGQTMAAPYCIRPKQGAPVSMPLEWEEVNSKLNPALFNIKTVLTRLRNKGDVWKNFFKNPNDDLRDSIAKLEKILRETRNK